MAKGTEKKPRSHRKSNERKSKARVTKSPDLDMPSGVEATPIQLLAIMLKVVLKDRITDEEVDLICSTYYKTVKEWWG